MMSNMRRLLTTWACFSNKRYDKAIRTPSRRNNGRCNTHCMSIGARMLQSMLTMVLFTTRSQACHHMNIISHADESCRHSGTTNSTSHARKHISLLTWSITVSMCLDDISRTARFPLPRQRSMHSHLYELLHRSKSLGRISEPSHGLQIIYHGLRT